MSSIIAKLEDWTARIGVSNYELEYERWPNSPCILNYNDSIYRVRKWLDAEIANMDRVYNYSPEDSFFAYALRSEAVTREKADDAEVLARVKDDAGIVRQVNALAFANTQSVLDMQRINDERRQDESQERSIRDEQDAGLQAQIDTLAIALIRNSLNDIEAQQRMKDSSSTVLDEKLQEKVATNDEINEILDEIFP